MNQPPVATSTGHVADLVTFTSAVVAVGSFWQGVALALTIVSTIIAIVLGGYRLYDRIKYGPYRRG